MPSSENFSKRNLVALVDSGEEFISRQEAIISGALREIHLQSYIFESDQTGLRIVQALKDAAKSKELKIYILVDAYGSQNFSATLRKELLDAGIKFRRFGKFYSSGSFHIGRRLHQKIIVADGEVAMVGGFNISDKYTSQPGSPAWLDFAVQVNGEAARRLLLICRKKWMKTSFKVFPKKLREGIVTNPQNTQMVRVKASQNDYINRKNEIALTYRKVISSSQKTLTIVGGYFLPGGRMRRILAQASERGVDIRVLVSDTSDVKLVQLARRYLYSWLLRHKIRIYEYLPSNVHGKVLISDEKFVSIGSYDLNNLSTYSNIELNLDIDDADFSGIVNRKLNYIIEKDCRLVTEENFRKRFGILDKFLSWFGYQLVKTFFVLSLIFAKKSE